MYPIGVLFGLGFDTATEVALLFLAAGAAGAGLPFYAILCLPILFAAGMSLLDTIDGSLHELRLRLGLLQAGAEDLLQPDDHRALGASSRWSIGTIEIARPRCPRSSVSTAAPGTGLRIDRPQLDRVRDRRRCSSSPGSSPSRSGTSATSRSAGRRRSSAPSDQARRQGPAPRRATTGAGRSRPAVEVCPSMRNEALQRGKGGWRGDHARARNEATAMKRPVLPPSRRWE